MYREAQTLKQNVTTRRMRENGDYGNIGRRREPKTG
jgi:hypothetical protein